MLGIVALVALTVVGASMILQGSRLARLVDRLLPEFRGKIQVGGIRWTLGIIPAVLRGTPSPIEVDGVVITDPEGARVLDVPHLTARIEVHLSPLKIIIHDLQPGVATWRFGAMKKQEGIGFTAALESAGPAPAEPPAAIDKAAAGPGFLFQIASAQLDGLTAVFDFPAWGLELKNIKADASLIMTSLDPAKPPFFGFDVTSLDARNGGYLRILEGPAANVLPFDRVEVARVATTPDWANSIFLHVEAARTGRSVLRAKGFFTGIYEEGSEPGIDMHAEIEEAADGLGAVAAGRQIAGLEVSGEGTSMEADLKGTFLALKVRATFEKLDVRFDTYRAMDVGFKFTFDAGAMKVGLRDFGFLAPGGGRFQLDADLDASNPADLGVTADLALAGFTTDSYVPRGLRTLAAGKVTGKLHAEAQTGARRAQVRGLDVTLARARGGGLPRRIRVRGDASGTPDKVVTSGIAVEVPGARATAKGELALAKKLVAMGLRVAADDLPRVLKAVGAPSVARQATLAVDVDGRIDNPSATGEASIKDVGLGGLMLSTIDANFSLQNGTARLEQLSGPAFGGTLEASGQIQLYKRTTARMLKSPVVALQLDGRDIDLTELLHAPALTGRISFHATADGPLDALALSIRVPPGARLRILDESYAVGAIEAQMRDDEITIKTAHLTREEGGAVDVQGKITLGGPLGVDVTITKLPLSGLPVLAGALKDAGVDLSGTFSARLHIGGRFTNAPGAALPIAPELSGELRLDDLVARGSSLGDGVITLSTTPDGWLVASGDLFERIHVEGRVALRAGGPEAHGVVYLRRLALEDLVPDLMAPRDAKAMVSGRVAVDLIPGSPLSVDARLTEIAASVAREVEGDDGDITVRRVEVKNATPLHATVVGDRITLDPFRLATRGGELAVEGQKDGDRLRAKAEGRFDLGLIAPLVAGSVETLSGTIQADLSVGGTVSAPALQGRVVISEPVTARPTGFETEVTIPSGTIEVSPRPDRTGVLGVRLVDLAVAVDGATLRVDGSTSIEPATADAGAGPALGPFNLTIGGEVSARLLESLAPDAVSDALGRAKVSARVSGTLERPQVRARLDLGLIDFRLRDLGREVQLQSGVVEIDNQGATLQGVRAQIDDRGKLVIGGAGVRPGRVQFESLVPFRVAGLDLPLRGEQISYRTPGALEIDDLAFDLALTGELAEGLSLAGDVRIVSGRYLQDFKIQDLVLSPRIDESAVGPFYEGNPLLENLALNLRVRTVGDGFVVQNNLAPEIHLDVDLRVGGTIPEPRIGGDIRLLDGRFHIIGLRGDFTLVPNVGYITFVDTKSIARQETPELLIEALNPITDAAGNDRVVRLRISGPIGQAQIELSSDDGLDTGQALLLLVSGRTGEEGQRLGTSNPTVGANINTGTDVAGQLTRDTVANLLEPYIDDTVFRLTGFNLRPGIGPDGFEGVLFKRFGRYTNLKLQTLFGFQNQRQYNLSGTFWLMDFVTLTGFGQRLTMSSQGLTEVDDSLNLELRLEFPIRF